MIRNWISDEQTQWDYGEPCHSTPEAVRELIPKKKSFKTTEIVRIKC